MNEQKIHELLQRYFEGASSLDEERELHRYFAGEHISDTLKAYRPLFMFFAEERSIAPPKPKAVTRNLRIGLSIVTGIAASIAILFLVGVPKMQSDNYVYYVDGQRIYDETAAIAMAENKLQLLAASMQKAQSSMAVFERVHESNQMLHQFEKISNAYQLVERKLEINN
jgi:hypothetical protein